MNRIHLIYPKTKWRPTYFYYIDRPRRTDLLKAPINANKDIVKHMWLLKDYRDGLPVGHPNHEDFPPEWAIGDLPNTTWIPRCKHQYLSPGHPSGMKEWHLPDICTAYNGMSGVMQIAVSLGYDEIYLLGCDLGHKVDPRLNHFDPDYAQGEVPTTWAQLAVWAHTDIQFATAAHEIAKKECEKRGVKVYNATLGGELEVYERVKLEDIL